MDTSIPKRAKTTLEKVLDRFKTPMATPPTKILAISRSSPEESMELSLVTEFQMPEEINSLM